MHVEGLGWGLAHNKRSSYGCDDSDADGDDDGGEDGDGEKLGESDDDEDSSGVSDDDSES